MFGVMRHPLGSSFPHVEQFWASRAPCAPQHSHSAFWLPLPSQMTPILLQVGEIRGWQPGWKLPLHGATGV